MCMAKTCAEECLPEPLKVEWRRVLEALQSCHLETMLIAEPGFCCRACVRLASCLPPRLEKARAFGNLGQLHPIESESERRGASVRVLAPCHVGGTYVGHREMLDS